MWRTSISPASNDLNANWSFLDLGSNGYVTSIKYVGYAWYIATWDPTANIDPASGQPDGQSSLFFASINFSAISPLDAWNSGENNLFRVSDIAATTLLPGTCDKALGFEPDPNNPTNCVKTCPDGFTPFGTLCVQSCPGPYSETGVPNECQPDSYVPRTTTPSASGLVPFTEPPKEGPQRGQQSAAINWTSFASISILVIICVLVLLGLIVNGRRTRK
jgi:hypothetical protein